MMIIGFVVVVFISRSTCTALVQQAESIFLTLLVATVHGLRDGALENEMKNAPSAA